MKHSSSLFSCVLFLLLLPACTKSDLAPTDPPALPRAGSDAGGGDDGGGSSGGTGGSGGGGTTPVVKTFALAAPTTFSVKPAVVTTDTRRQVIADFDGDQKADILIFNGGLYFFKGNGNGTFAAAKEITALKCAVGALNLDQNGTQLRVNAPKGSLSLFKNGNTYWPLLSNGASDVSGSSYLIQNLFGSGSDSSAQCAGAVSYQPRAYGSLTAYDFGVSGDFDGDQHQDIAVIDRAFVSLFLNKSGDNVFLPYATNANPPVFPGVYEAQLTSKVTECGESQNKGKCGMDFSSATLLTASDFDKTGTDDLVFVNGDNHDLVVMPSTPKNTADYTAGGTFLKANIKTFTPAFLLKDAQETVSDIRGLAAADLNGDGFTDLAVPQAGAKKLVVMLGGPNGFEAANVSLYSTTGVDASDAAIADLNADGKPDIVTINFASLNGVDNGSVDIWMNQGNGHFDRSTQSVVLGNTPAGHAVKPRAVLLSDVNGDGLADIILFNEFPADPDPTVSVVLNRTQ